MDGQLTRQRHIVDCSIFLARLMELTFVAIAHDVGVLRFRNQSNSMP